MSIDMSQFYQVFFEEAQEHLDSREHLLLESDLAAPNPEDLNAVFRAAHSIKGSAGTFGFQGQADIPLNDTGRAQAQAAAQRLATFSPDRIVASDLSRAQTTARIIADALNIALHNTAGTARLNILALAENIMRGPLLRRGVQVRLER